MASIEDTISRKTSMILLSSERIMEDDNNAAEREKNPLSCFQKHIYNIKISSKTKKIKIRRYNDHEISAQQSMHNI